MLREKKVSKIFTINISKDAEEERPAPFGRFPLITKSIPLSILYPFSISTFSTPLR